MKERRPPHRKVLPFRRTRRGAGTGGDAPYGAPRPPGPPGLSGGFVAPDGPPGPAGSTDSAGPDLPDGVGGTGTGGTGSHPPELVVVPGRGGRGRAPRSLGAVAPPGLSFRCMDGLADLGGPAGLCRRPGAQPTLRRLPLFKRILRRFADAAARRIGILCGVGCVITPDETRLCDMAGCAGLLARPAMHRFGVVPLEGTAALLFDHSLREAVTWLGLGVDPRGMAGSWPGSWSGGDSMPPPPGSGGRNGWLPGHAEAGLCAHLGRQLQLDLEWAFLPYFEIETSGCDAPPGEPGGQPAHAREALRPDWTALGEPLVPTPFEVALHWPSPAAVPGPAQPSIPQELAPPPSGQFGQPGAPSASWNGRLMLVLPLAMLLPLADLLADDTVLLAPEQTESAESAHDRLQVLSDADLAARLAEGHPQTAAVVVARLAPQRRDGVLALLGPELGAEVRRRMARRRLFREVLSPEQRFVVRTLALGEVHAAQTLAAMRPEAAARFVRVMRGLGRGLGSLYAEQVEAVLRDDGAGLAGAEDLVLEGESQVRRLLMRALGPDDMRAVRACLDAAACRAPAASPASPVPGGPGGADGVDGADAGNGEFAEGGPASGQATHDAEPFAPLLGVPAVALARLLTAEGLAVTVAVLRHLSVRDARRAAAVLGALPTAWAGPVVVGLSPEVGENGGWAAGLMGQAGQAGLAGQGGRRQSRPAHTVRSGSLEALLVAENALCRALPEEHACRVLALPVAREEEGRDAPPATALAALLRHGGDAVREAALQALRRRRSGDGGDGGDGPRARDGTRPGGAGSPVRPAPEDGPPFPSDDDVS
ncbi:hypothetical protein [Nitratidesulfovibrio sp. 1201_IL3209]|uniref:hypothetical protein n=1 Tax=Nitratidesulfovibrio sp. 1201_IL3209 TaxID=3084053 RepID=UPI002FDA7C6A